MEICFEHGKKQERKVDRKPFWSLFSPHGVSGTLRFS